MGTGSSSMSGGITRIQLLKGTEKTREIMDITLDFLLKNLQLRDFYSLSNPERCRKYVLFTANMLYSKFIQFKIAPTVDKSGTIMFRSVQDLTNPPDMKSDPSKSETLEQQSLCLKLAYFYVRIFQIYGALALTLIDESIEQKGQIKYARGILQAPGTDIYSAAAPLHKYTIGTTKDMRVMFGGSLFDIKNKFSPIPPSQIGSLGLFQCLHSILYTPIGVGAYDHDRGQGYDRGQDYGTRQEYAIKFIAESDGDMPVSAILRILGSKQRRDSKFIQNGELELQSGRENKIIIKIIAEAIIGIGEQYNTINILFQDNFNIRKGGISNVGNFGDIRHIFKFSVIGQREVEQQYPITILNWGSIIDRKQISVENTIHKFISRIWRMTEMKPTGATMDTDKTFTEIDRVDPHLKIQPLIDGLTRKRKFAHCVGRALQLLSSTPIFSSKTDSGIESRICDVKFSKEYIDTPIDAPLYESASILSLANLFYDLIQTGSPRVTFGQESLQEYIKFVKEMSVIFTGNATHDIQDIQKGEEQIFKKISSSERDRAICGSSRGPLVIGNEFAKNEIYPIVQSLFRRQLVHASNCSKILIQLFDIQQKKDNFNIRIHPNVMTKGIPEIDRIMKMTRNMLIKYYGDCEADYVAGMTLIKGKSEPDKSDKPIKGGYRVRFDLTRKKSLT